MKALFAIALALATLCHLSHRALMAIPVPAPSGGLHDTLASPEALRLLTLGYGELGADYYWLRAISHFGDKSMHHFKYPNLWPLLERAIALDPKFASAYVMAGQALPFAGIKPEVAMKLLRQGMAERPDSWRLPFVLGFDAYYFYNDYATAAQALTQSARLPGAPDYVGPFATRLAAEAGEPEIGLQFIDAMLEHETDPTILRNYQQRRRLLILEIYLKNLNRAVAEYKQTHPQGPDSLDDLVQARIIPQVPPDPMGGAFFLDSNKVVHTQHEAERIKLPAAARRPNRALHQEANARP